MKSEGLQHPSSNASSSSSLDTIENSLRYHEILHTRAEPSPLSCFFKALSRRKPLDGRTETRLNKCLNLLDLTSLGVGTTLGLGLFVLAGQVSSTKAGPAVLISFALAALASALSALCYAELASRVPKAGSAYAYSYITMGEFVAFVIGWNMILEYVIGASTVARGFSDYICYTIRVIFQALNLSDSEQRKHIKSNLLGDNITSLNYSNSTETNRSLMLGSWVVFNSESYVWPLVDYLNKYFDWPSLVIVSLMTLILFFGVKGSTKTTMLFTLLNIATVIFLVINSLTSLDLHNWQLDKSEVPSGFGQGGFMPYGWQGVIAGSATCFFGFIGFDTIASSAEEAKNPKRNVPFSIMLSLFISFIAYMLVATAQTLIWPYYDQDRVVILPYIFDQLNKPLAFWVILIGALSGLTSSLVGGVYPLPRVIYSMARDRLIFGWLSQVSPKLKLPVRATLVGSVLVGVFACLLDVQELADMVSIGTLSAYTLVSLSVLILRYENREDSVDDSTIMSNRLSFSEILTSSEQLSQMTTGMKSVSKVPRQKLGPKPSTPIREKGSRPLAPQLSVGFNSWFKDQPHRGINETSQQKSVEEVTKKGPSIFKLMTQWRSEERADRRQPDDHSSKQSKILIGILVIVSILLDLLFMSVIKLEKEPSSDVESFSDPKTLLYCLGSIGLIVMMSAILMLSRLPISKQFPNDSFKTPWVPLLPTLSILVNVALMINLSYLTWVRFCVWMTLGLLIYLTYGIWNSEGYLLSINN